MFESELSGPEAGGGGGRDRLPWARKSSEQKGATSEGLKKQQSMNRGATSPNFTLGQPKSLDGPGFNGKKIGKAYKRLLYQDKEA